MDQNDIPTDLNREPSPDELAIILSRYRDKEFAGWFLFSFALAATQYPEEVRKAIGSVFSIKAIEAENERMGRVIAQSQSVLNEIRAEIQEARDDLEAVRGDMAVQRGDFDLLRQRCLKMKEWLDDRAAEVQQAAATAAGQVRRPRTKPKVADGA